MRLFPSRWFWNTINPIGKLSVAESVLKYLKDLHSTQNNRFQKSTRMYCINKLLKWQPSPQTQAILPSQYRSCKCSSTQASHWHSNRHELQNQNTCIGVPFLFESTSIHTMIITITTFWDENTTHSAILVLQIKTRVVQSRSSSSLVASQQSQQTEILHSAQYDLAFKIWHAESPYSKSSELISKSASDLGALWTLSGPLCL